MTLDSTLSLLALPLEMKTEQKKIMLHPIFSSFSPARGGFLSIFRESRFHPTNPYLSCLYLVFNLREICPTITCYFVMLLIYLIIVPKKCTL
jgi:hypothetical protein